MIGVDRRILALTPGSNASKIKEDFSHVWKAIGELQASQSSIQRQLSQCFSLVADLRTDVNSLRGIVSGLDASVDKIESTVSEHGSAITRLDQNISSLGQDLVDLRQSVDGLRSEVNDHSGQLADHDARLDSNRESIAANASALTALSREVSQLRNDLTPLTSDVASLQSRLDAISATVASHTTSLSDGDRRISQLETAVTQATPIINRLVTHEISNVSSPLAINNGILSLSLTDPFTASSAGLGLRLLPNSCLEVRSSGLSVKVWGVNAGVALHNDGLYVKLAERYTGLQLADGGLKVFVEDSTLGFRDKRLALADAYKNPINNRITTLENLKVTTWSAPLRRTGTTVALLYEGADFQLDDSSQLALRPAPRTTYSFPLVMDESSRTLSLSSGYRYRHGQWRGQAVYSHTAGTRITAECVIDLFISPDRIHLTFHRMEFDRSYPMNGKWSFNFVTGLTGLFISDLQPPSDALPYDACIAPCRFSLNHSSSDAFRALHFSDFTEGELELSDVGGTYATNDRVVFFAFSLSYPT
uniref:Sigma 1 n=1 Tax=Phocid orthoreovirus 1 TaxID=2854225 RepID=A0A7L5EP22_9REOV|nr:Sigma 1 [Phocid orthoreovirus 1]